jgi:hypothetical protein
MSNMESHLDQYQVPTSTECHLTIDGTPGHIHVDNLTQQSADKASELLNINHASYHTRWAGTFHSMLKLQ